MPKIPSYPPIQEISDDDLMIIDDASRDYSTKSVTAAQLASYFNNNNVDSGAWRVFNRTFSGNELMDAFNGNTTDKITLVAVNNNQVAVVDQVHAILKSTSTGTTNYAITADVGDDLYIIPEGSIYQWGTLLTKQMLTQPYDRYGIFNSPVSLGNTTSDFSQRPAGADIVLGIPSGKNGVDITAGDRDVVISVIYRLIDFS